MIKYGFASLITLGLMFGMLGGLIIAAMVWLDMLHLWLAILITLGLNGILFVLSPYITDFMLKHINGINWWSPDELKEKQPALYQLMQSICTEHNYTMPRFGFIADDNPTAFTYGIFRNDARIVMTAGIFKYLSTPQAHAVLAHEMGHITHYDFAVMTAASVLVQILYQVYASLGKSKKGSRDKDGKGALYIAIAAYVAYVFASYLLLFLSRSREYMADGFAARYTSAQDLAGALIRIAYGIIEVDDTDSTHHLLHSTRQLGIIDVTNARQAGLLVKNSTMDKTTVARSMLFDLYNPWAVLLELQSTHPLTGKRLQYLGHVATSLKQPFPSLDFRQAAADINLDKSRLWNNFAQDIAVAFLPWVMGALGFLISWYAALPLLCLGLLLQILYVMPSKAPAKTTAINLLCNPYASPLRGQPVVLEGQAIGRLNPGSKFNEDMMFQDSSGLVPLDFQSWLGFIGNIFAGLKKIQNLLHKPAIATGWYYRGLSGYVRLNTFVAEETTLKARPYLGAAIGLGLFAGLGCWLIYYITTL